MRGKTVLFLFLFTLSSTTAAMAISSINVPLDNWAYPALEKLDGFGLLRSDLPGIRPFTRMEVARLVQEALTEKEYLSTPLPPLAGYLLDKFKREYKAELGAYGGEGGAPPSTYIKPIEEVQARYVYLDGEPRAFLNIDRFGQGQYPKSRYGIIASEGTPLVYNNEGVVYGKNNNFSLQFSSSFRYLNIFSGYLEPLLVARQHEGRISNFSAIDIQSLPGHLGQFDHVEVDLLKGYGKISPWNVELEVGRDSMWWGNGRHGEFIFTNNAAPLPMLKLSNPIPSLLPWYFRYLGPFKYSFFASRLEDDRVIQHPLLMGVRADFKPLPILEIGFNTTFISSGKGQPPLTASDFFSAVFGFGFGVKNELDQRAGMDVRLQLPFLRNTEIYVEYAGEDSGGPQYPEEWLGLGDIGWLVGVYVPRLTDDGRSDLRLEFAHNAHRVDSTPGFWYGNGQFKSGYTYEGMILGHHMGGDAVDVFVRTTRYIRNDLVLGLDYDHMTRGITLNEITNEHVNQFGADLTYEVRDDLSITARYGFETVDNWNLVRGENRQNHLLMTGIKLDF